MRTLRERFRHWTWILKQKVLPVRRKSRKASREWRALYVAAVSETDNQRVAGRIADAKKALVQRARELFPSAEDHLQEESAIDDALLALRVLERSVLHVRTPAR